MTSDGSINLQGGTISISMTGAGGKGIKSDGTIVVGLSDTEGPVLTVSTTGAKYLSTSSAKAIKATGAITVNGGETVVTTSTQGAEGLESKLKSNASIVFNGGKHYFKCYDDCLNTAGAIRFDGGIVVCHGYGNDAIDSNYGQAGAIQIGNGVVLGYSSKGAPEEGFDGAAHPAASEAPCRAIASALPASAMRRTVTTRWPTRAATTSSPTPWKPASAAACRSSQQLA